MIPLPHDPEAEASFLATCCAPGGSQEYETEIRRLTPEHFVVPRHRAIFTALHSLTLSHDEVNAVTLKSELGRLGLLQKADGFHGVTEAMAAPELGRPFRLVEILSDRLSRRQLMKAASRAISAAAMDEQEISGLCVDLMTECGNIAREGHEGAIGSWGEILEIMDEGQPFRDGSGARGGSWGIPELDDHAPIPCGEVTFIAARPGVGKTALLTQIAVESALMGRKPLIVSIELRRKTVLARLVSYLAKISTRKLKEGHYSRYETERIRQHLGAVLNGSVYSPSAGTSWDKIEATCLEAIEKFGVNTILIDYFSLIGRGNVGRGSSEAYAFARVSERITAFAKDHAEVAVILLGQLKQDEAGKEPKDGGVADSDRPARDAAVSLFLWRDPHEQIWSVLTKNRDGALGWKRPLDFDGSCQQFTLKAFETAPVGRLSGSRL